MVSAFEGPEQSDSNVNSFAFYNDINGTNFSLIENDSSSNMNNITDFSDLQFNERHLNQIITYAVLMVLGIIGNVGVVISLHRRRTGPEKLLLLHLAIADLQVVLFLIPMEIGWRITTRWIGGDLACRLCMMCRAFPLYLSSLLVVSISIDRYVAVIYPLKNARADTRVKALIVTSWCLSFISSLPQVCSDLYSFFGEVSTVVVLLLGQ